MPTLVHGGLSCVALRLAWTGGDAGEGSRVLYRLWRTEEGGHLIEAAVVPRRVGRRPRRAERRAAWVGEGVDAEALLARLASPDDPVHPIHLADVVRDALWLAARGALKRQARSQMKRASTTSARIQRSQWTSLARPVTSLRSGKRRSPAETPFAML